MENFQIQTNNTFKANETRVHEILEKNYKDYSICIHGIKGGYEPRQITAEKIVATGLLFMGTGNNICMEENVKPYGLVNEESLKEAKAYEFFPSNNEGINVMVLIPSSITIKDQTYYLGYPDKDIQEPFTKKRNNFTCLIQKIIDNLGYIPSYFIYGYCIYNPTTKEREYIINRNHISFRSLEEQEELYQELIETSPINEGVHYKYFDVRNEDFFRRLNNLSAKHNNYLTNTAKEYINVYKVEELKKIKN